MTRIVIANIHQKITCKDEIQLCAQNVDTNLYSIRNITRRQHVWSLNKQWITTKPNSQFTVGALTLLVSKTLDPFPKNDDNHHKTKIIRTSIDHAPHHGHYVHQVVVLTHHPGLIMNLSLSYIWSVDSKLQGLWLNRIPQFCEYTDACYVTSIHLSYFLLNANCTHCHKCYALRLSEPILHSEMMQSNLKKVLFGALNPSNPWIFRPHQF